MSAVAESAIEGAGEGDRIVGRIGGEVDEDGPGATPEEHHRGLRGAPGHGRRGGVRDKGGSK